MPVWAVTALHRGAATTPTKKMWAPAAATMVSNVMRTTTASLAIASAIIRAMRTVAVKNLAPPMKPARAALAF